jgi:uncharacterized protein YndB with AHSA1/START domain/DNA-binding transcriptional ArsR family regulator
VEDVFRALGDPSRRMLLDRLFDEDGRTLSELCASLPAMTRFGVMKHLDILEQAGLVVTQRQGREKLHYLNPVPIRLMHDRWISKFREPQVRALVDLKYQLEGIPMPSKPTFVHEIVIRASIDEVWTALTKPEFTERYYYGSRVEMPSFEPGATYRYVGNGAELLAGEILESDPPNRLVMTFNAKWDESLLDDAPSRLTWELTEMGPAVTSLKVIHDGFDTETATYQQVAGGWPFIVSGLKTLVETGAPLMAGAN